MALLEYRNTHISNKIFSPVEILYNRKKGLIHTNPESLKPKLINYESHKKNLQNRQKTQKIYYDRTTKILIHATNNDIWTPAVIVNIM